MAESTELRLVTVDAFADVAFSGNPAAVVLLDKAYSEEIYQKIAFEMNLSETSFVVPVDSRKSLENADKFCLRWFTPTSEVPLCGHATLATAHVIFNVLGNPNSTLIFDTKSGDLVCKKVEDLIGMDFPQYHVKEVSQSNWPQLFSGAEHADWFKNLILSPLPQVRGFDRQFSWWPGGLRSRYRSTSDFRGPLTRSANPPLNWGSKPPTCSIVDLNLKNDLKEASGGLKVDSLHLCERSKKLLIVLDSLSSSRKDLEDIHPNPEKLRSFHPSGDTVRGVCVSLRGTETNGCKDQHGKNFDFISRYFAPWVGIPEDPATGSAHCALGPYWASVLKKNDLYARQCSKRGANFLLKIRDENDRIEITGKGIVILDGHLRF